MSCVAATIVAFAGAARATTYEVGPSKPFSTLQAVAPLLNPGDLVLVDGNATYPGGIVLDRAGSAASKITIRGVRIAGQRPLLSGGVNTNEFRASHYVFETFEVAGGSFRGIYHHADDIAIRDCLVRDCPAHGILGADMDSGSLLLEYTEVRGCGNGTSQHQIYMATDDTRYPQAVFRMQHCWVHDATGGNNVKSRAGRNEIYSNWIEGAQFHELELIGADGQPEDLVREDSDVVGNVLRKISTQGTFVARIGGDGTGTSNGRYRFVGNTILLAPNTTAAVFRLFTTVQSFEAHDNVVYKVGGGGAKLTDTSGLTIPVSSVAMAGSHNWVPTGSTNVPAAWTGTMTGATPGFTDVAALDLRPLPGSPLVDAGVYPTASPPGFPFVKPLGAPIFHPPFHAIGLPGSAKARPVNGALDVGAFELPGPVLHGSGEDLALASTVDGLGDPDDPLKCAATADALSLRVSSPGGALVGSIPILAAQGFPWFAPQAPYPGFPYLHLDPALVLNVTPATGPLTPSGLVVPVVVPAGLSGLTIRFQALAVSLSAANGFFATSDPHDVRIE